MDSIVLSLSSWSECGQTFGVLSHSRRGKPCRPCQQALVTQQDMARLATPSILEGRHYQVSQHEVILRWKGEHFILSDTCSAISITSLTSSTLSEERGASINIRFSLSLACYSVEMRLWWPHLVLSINGSRNYRPWSAMIKEGNFNQNCSPQKELPTIKIPWRLSHILQFSATCLLF